MKENAGTKHIWKFIPACWAGSIKAEAGVIFAKNIITRKKKDTNGNFRLVASSEISGGLF